MSEVRRSTESDAIPLARRCRLILLRICRWTTSAELVRLLGMDSCTLTRRHLMPMVQRRVPERLCAEQPKHPDQAYRVRSGLVLAS